MTAMMSAISALLILFPAKASAMFLAFDARILSSSTPAWVRAVTRSSPLMNSGKLRDMMASRAGLPMVISLSMLMAAPIA